MQSIWEVLCEAMPQSGKFSVTVKLLLQQYKERCRAERSQHGQEESTLALLPVSFAQAKDWLLKQQRLHSQAIEAGTINKAAREAVAELSLHLLLIYYNNHHVLLIQSFLPLSCRWDLSL
jgi:hypothetical protein